MVDPIKKVYRALESNVRENAWRSPNGSSSCRCRKLRYSELLPRREASQIEAQFYVFRTRQRRNYKPIREVVQNLCFDRNTATVIFGTQKLEHRKGCAMFGY